MAKWKIDRTTIFLWLVFFLFLWDLAYFLGIRDPNRIPHPFAIFRTLGDVEFLRGFPAMLRQIIFCLVCGGLVGVAIASVALSNSWLTQGTLRFLRIGLWLPFLIIFAVPATFWLSITAVTLCICYHYLAARSLLRLERHDALSCSMREGVLQALFITLISQIWVQRWVWFNFLLPQNPAVGVEVLALLVTFLGFVNWLFRFDFDADAEKRATILNKEISGASWRSSQSVTLFAVTCLVIWQLFSAFGFSFLRTSPRQVVNAAYFLFVGGEVWNDIEISLLEVLGGLVLGGSVALAVFAFLSLTPGVRKVLFPLVPITYISPIALWLEVFLLWSIWAAANRQAPVQSFIYLWHKVVAVGCLTFFPLVQTLWGLRTRSWPFRMFVALDNALPIAFVAMLFGELMAATAGLGFLMVVASATYQTDKGLAGFLITVALLTGLSAILRSTARRLSFSETNTSVHPAQVS